MRIEILEEDQRQDRERVKMEQDEAYQESLLADRAKEEARKQKELMMETERTRLESERAEIIAKKESIRMEAERALPPEPTQTSGPEITKIKIRTNDGMIERRFMATDTLQVKFSLWMKENKLNACEFPDTFELRHLQGVSNRRIQTDLHFSKA